MLISLLISLAIIVILCCLLNIKTRDTIVVCIISILIVGILDRFFNLEQKVNNMMINNNIPIFNNNSLKILNQRNEFVGAKKSNQKAIKVNSLNCKLIQHLLTGGKTPLPYLFFFYPQRKFQFSF